MRLRLSDRPPCSVVAPPESPVPAPRGVTGICFARAQRTSAHTSSAERGDLGAVAGARALERRSELHGRQRLVALVHAQLAIERAVGPMAAVHDHLVGLLRPRARSGREQRTIAMRGRAVLDPLALTA